MYKKVIKPILDYSGALMIALLTAPVWIITGILLLVQNRGDVFFIQERTGKHGRAFKMLKFKTMRNCTVKDAVSLSDSERLTAVGRWIRRLSIDELPQIVNILKGEMSFMGPRPLLPEYLPLYSMEQYRRHEVKPGITGWSQVHGRNDIDWARKFELDVWYVDNLSFNTDLRIFLLTLKDLLDFQNLGNKVKENVEKFNGSN